MRIRVCVVGKPKLGYAKAGVEEYSSRLNKTGRFELVQVREGKQNEESLRLLEASQSYLRVVLDERGELADTLSLHKKLLDWELHGEKGVAFLIGGANGHTEELRRRADWLLSLSRFTLQPGFYHKAI